MKKAIIDTSSAILIYKSGLLELLTMSYHVLLADSVFHELTQNPYPGSHAILKYQKSRKIRIINIAEYTRSGSGEIPGLERLGAGERDSIFLYHHHAGHFIIIDDKKGASFCRENHVPFINALLFPRILFLSGALIKHEYLKYADQIIGNGWYSKDIIRFAMNCTREDMDFFL